MDQGLEFGEAAGDDVAVRAEGFGGERGAGAEFCRVRFIAPIHAALIEHGAMNRTLPSPARPANEPIALAAARVSIPTIRDPPGDVLPRTAAD